VNGNNPHSHDVGLETAFDFLNTKELESGALVDRLVSVDDAFRWFQEHHVVHAEPLEDERRKVAADQAAGERALTRIRRVRDALREVTDAVVQRRAPEPGALSEVNRALRAREIVQLEAWNDGVHVGHRHVGDPIDDALARLADPIVGEISGGRPERLRICDNDTCRWVFYDDSPTGRRRWCDMATCGNRAKAARHRARQKQAAGKGNAEAN
jgi:predicted RNA-binding Zn ribbon-like protein